MVSSGTNNGSQKRKWSLKYKKSINCKRPKGFSQKQFCRSKNRKSKKIQIQRSG